MNMLKIQKKYLYLLTIILSVILGVISIFFLYYFNWTIILESYLEHEGSLGVVLVISSRIAILSGMGVYTFYQWFKQEEQYPSDIPFLFGLFFLFLVFGKFLDLYNAFMYFQLDMMIVLLILKIRFFVMILTFLPMIYLSSEMILFSFSLKPRFKALTSENVRNKVSFRLIIVIFTIESIAGIIAPDSRVLSIYYPVVVIPSLLTIIWLFNFARKNKRLSQVNASILTISFIAYLITQIIRPLAQILMGESVVFLIFAETMDLIVFLFIFIGFYKKAPY